MAQCDPVTVQIISEEKVTNSGSPALSMKTMPLWAGTTENPRKMRTIELVGGLGSSKVRENPNSVQGNIVLASVRRSVIVRIRWDMRIKRVDQPANYAARIADF